MKGFKGKLAEKFVDSINEVVMNNIESPLIETDDSLSKGIKWDENYNLSKNVSNIGDDRIISFSDDQLFYITEQIKQIDDEVTNVMFYIIERIEKMCKEDYYIPSAIPKILEMLEYFKKQLQESNDISQQTSKIVMDFADNIIDQDSNI